MRDHSVHGIVRGAALALALLCVLAVLPAAALADGYFNESESLWDRHVYVDTFSLPQAVYGRGAQTCLTMTGDGERFVMRGRRNENNYIYDSASGEYIQLYLDGRDTLLFTAKLAQMPEEAMEKDKVPSSAVIFDAGQLLNFRYSAPAGM